MIDNQIKLCAQLRQISIRAVIETVSALHVGITSELDALHLLVDSLRSYGVSDYWYPAGEEGGASQSGCIVAFDTANFPSRSAFPNGRTLVASQDIAWEGLGYFYVSPQQIDNGGEIGWGDFGCSVYTGDSSTIRSFFRRSWILSEALIHQINTNRDITTRAVFQSYQSLAKDLEITNVAMSTTAMEFDCARLNIGHSFPIASSLDESPASANVSKVILKNRIFINDSAAIAIKNAIWSLESRDVATGYSYGAISFHRMFAVTSDGFFLLPDCSEFLEAVEMNWIFASNGNE